MKTLFVILTLVITIRVAAQEHLIPMSINPALSHKKTEKSNEKGSVIHAVKLPFADDFSRNSIYPDKRLWTNDYVFVNKGFAVNPVTIGVATFDAVNDTGTVYPHALQFPFVADSLTSQPIRLDSLFGAVPKKLYPSDSVYISFYIQPGGRGNSPETDDSLILQFYNPKTSAWKTVWEHEGMELDSFRNKYGKDFAQFNVAITDSDYFSDGFRIRFMNKASIPNNTIPSWRSGLYDQWNLDYVYIDANRTYNDTSLSDVAFIEYASSLLNNYVSMPWNQYQANAAAETNHSLSLKFKNLDYHPIVKNMNKYFHITDLNTKNIVKKSKAYPSSSNMNAGQTITYSPDYGNFIFQNSGVQYPDFEVIFRILTHTPPPGLILTNDTMRFYQKFYNYYAYDDGVPEAGYGLSNNNARLAYQFTLNTGDSLQSIQIYFNQTLGLANQQYFYLTVWDDNNGQPGNVIYEQSNVLPEFENDIFKYHTYELKKAVYISGTFYIGWRQTTVDNLNVGFDFNNDHHNRIFYNTSGSWTNSSFAGALMMRPVLGNSKTAYVGIKNTLKNPELNVNIYPNPLSGRKLHIVIRDDEYNNTDGTIEIISVTGQIVLFEKLKKTIDTGDLPKGLYIVRIKTASGISKTQKLIIQ